MDEQKDNTREQEMLRTENNFLKMKMMLEYGAQFVGNHEELPPEIENQVLRNMMAFEQEFKEHKKIRVFDKIGQPKHFRPVREIPETGIDQAWEELLDYLNSYRISLDVCSPNITRRELYRFTIEELFAYEMEDMDLPGWSTNFIYDEFHPDPVYDNARMVQSNLFPDFFRKDPMIFEFYFCRQGIFFNEKLFENFSALNEVINKFKALFDEINLEECLVESCVVNEKDSFVRGTYIAKGIIGGEKFIYEGDYLSEFVWDETGEWLIKKLQIQGLDL